MSDFDPRKCILDECRVQASDRIGYEVVCVNDFASHVCLTKSREMFMDKRIARQGQP